MKVAGRRHGRVTAPLLAFLSACGIGDVEPTTHVVTAPDGTELVSTDWLPPWDDAQYQIPVHRVRSIGSGGNPSDPAQPALFDPRAVARFPDGSLVVFDGGPNPLVRISSTDSILGRFGAWGHGPAEIGTGYPWIWPSSDSTVAVVDITNQMLKEFTFDGQLSAETRLDYMGRARTPFYGSVPDRQALFAHFWYVGEREGEFRSLADSVRRVLPTPGPMVPLPAMSDESALRAGRLGRPWPRFVPLADESIVTGKSSEAVFSIYTPGGALLRRISLPLVRRPIDAREHADLLREFRSIPGVGGGPTPEVNSHYPVFSNLYALGDRGFAIEHGRRSLPDGDPVPADNIRFWRLVSTSGSFLGVVVLPEDFQTLSVHATGFWGVRIDAVGHPYLEEYLFDQPISDGSGH